MGNWFENKLDAMLNKRAVNPRSLSVSRDISTPYFTANIVTDDIETFNSFQEIKYKRDGMFMLTVDSVNMPFIIEGISGAESFPSAEWTVSAVSAHALIGEKYSKKLTYFGTDGGGNQFLSRANSYYQSTEAWLQEIFALSGYGGSLTISGVPHNHIYAWMINFENMYVVDMLQSICEDLRLLFIPLENGDFKIEKERQWIGLDRLYNEERFVIVPDHTVDGETQVEEISFSDMQGTGENSAKVISVTEQDAAGDAEISLATNDVIFPGAVADVTIYSSSSKKVDVSANHGSLHSQEGVVELGTKAIANESVTSSSEQTLQTQYKVDSTQAITVYCLDDGQTYTVDEYNDDTNTIILEDQLPYPDSILQVSYYAKHMSDVKYQCPDYHTKEIVLRASDKYTSGSLTLQTSDDNGMGATINIWTNDTLSAGASMTIHFYSSHTNTLDISTNRGSLSTSALSLSTSALTDEQIVSTSTASFSPSYSLDTSAGMSVYCHDDLSNKNVVAYQEIANNVVVSPALPYTNSLLEVDYTAHWFGNATLTVPATWTSEEHVVVRAENQYTNAYLDLTNDMSSNDNQVDFVLSDSSVYATGRHYIEGVAIFNQRFGSTRGRVEAEMGVITIRGANGTSNARSYDFRNFDSLYAQFPETNIEINPEDYGDAQKITYFRYYAPNLWSAANDGGVWYNDADGTENTIKDVVRVYYGSIEGSTEIELLNPSGLLEDMEVEFVLPKSRVRRDKVLDCLLVTPYKFNVFIDVAGGDASRSRKPRSAGGSRSRSASRGTAGSGQNVTAGRINMDGSIIGDSFDGTVVVVLSAYKGHLKLAGDWIRYEKPLETKTSFEYNRDNDQIQFVAGENGFESFFALPFKYIPWNADRANAEEIEELLVGAIVANDEVVASTTKTLTVRPAPGDPGYFITVTITDAATGKPISGASVQCNGKFANSGSDGVATVYGVTTGRHLLTINKLGYIGNQQDANTTNDYVFIEDEDDVQG